MSDFRSHIAIIDYGMGNLHSVAKALEHVCPGAKVSITADPALVEDADRVVFPGVGAIRDCMSEIKRLNVGDVVSKAMKTKPVLAICVGMQALMQHSEENGGVDCLELLPGQVKFFGDSLVDTQGIKLKVPHMGWNDLVITGAHPVLAGLKTGDHAYFVHSYQFVLEDMTQRLAHVDYDGEISAIVSSGTRIGMQFHPEKSQSTGLRLISNFLNWRP